MKLDYVLLHTLTITHFHPGFRLLSWRNLLYKNSIKARVNSRARKKFKKRKSKWKCVFLLFTGKIFRMNYGIPFKDNYGFDERFLEYLHETFDAKIKKIWIAEDNGKFAGCIICKRFLKHSKKFR